MKFLLFKGAIPTLGFGNAWPAKEEGGRGIGTWLNMNWEESVEWAEEQRALETGRVSRRQ
jgi:hypothetical protein